MNNGTPVMGWNTWNTFGWNINEELIKTTADYIAESGLRDAGYEYIIIDDCWSEKERDNRGRLVPDHNKFPGGIKSLSDYIHARGLKIGIYSCAGTHTCGGYPGSFEHEFEDARTFAEWDIDYLKYDYCYKPDSADGPNLYRRMAMALRNCGKKIVFAACNWGQNNIKEWARTAGADTYRSYGDIQDSWNSIKDIVYTQLGTSAFCGCYCHNDMDMLVVGMHGKGDNQDVLGKVVGGCTDTEYRTHFSIWALMNSPLIIGCDVRKMSDEAKKILTNSDIIAINQDFECRGPYCIRQWNNPENVFSLVRPLANGDYAIGMFNMSDTRSEMSLQFYDMGLTYSSGKCLSMYDCCEHRSLGTFSERFVTVLEPHDSLVLRAVLCDRT